MSEINSVPDLLRAVEDLTRRVYELQRRRGPRTGGGGDVTDPIIFRTDDGGPEEYVELTTQDVGTGRANLLLGYGSPGAEPLLETTLEFRSTTNGTFIDGSLPSHPNDTAIMYLTTSDLDADYTGGLLVVVTDDAWQAGGHPGRLAQAECDGRTADAYGATLLASASDPAAGEGSWFANLEWSDTFQLEVDYAFTGDVLHTWFFFGVAGAVSFGIFDQGDTPAAQVAAVDVSAETTAIQDIYAALRAYGWFAA